MTLVSQPKRQQYILSALIILTLAGYLLPWLTNPGVSLSLNAYDLAEWTSLHPSGRGDSIPLLTTLSLRLALVCLGLLVAFGRISSRLDLRLIVLILIGIALLPPLEFFIQATNDQNYRQQFVLTLITFFIGAVAFSAKFSSKHHIFFMSIATLGSVSSLYGLIQSYGLMRDFLLPTYFGFGGIISILAYGGIVIIALVNLKLKSKHGGMIASHATVLN